MAQQFADVDQVERKPVLEPTDPTLADAAYRDASLSIEKRIDDLLPRLTLEEQAEIIHGASAFTYGKMPRIGLAEYGTFDGPQGVRLKTGRGSTAFPSGIAMAATWNKDLLVEVGRALAEECKAANVRVLLGPGVNILRSPLGGRSFEYFGEDPVLAGKIAAGYINGLQDKNIAACLKHWLLNDQEWARTVINVDVGERALREIYAKPYEIAIEEANPWSIMTSYNRVRGLYPSANYQLNKILYKDWGWDGALISDWGAWHGDINALNGGCTICMPSTKNSKRNRQIAKMVEDGRIDKDMFEQAVRRNLRLSFRVGAFDYQIHGKANSDEAANVALQTAREAVVLLKNEEGILPFDVSKIRKVAVIGPNADEYHTMADGTTLKEKGGSGATGGRYEITPLKGLVNLLGEDRVLYAPGYRFRKPTVHSCPDLKEMDPIEAAKQADIVLFFAGTDHSYDRERLGWGILDGADKPDLNLKGEQADLIRKVAEANPKTIVVLTIGAPVQVEDWQDNVAAILCSWYGGQDAGTAIASILCGEVNPSGKLPVTFGRKLSDWLCHQLGSISYPGVIPEDRNGKAGNPQQFYGDYIWVGYRHFDKADIEPRYPFGYGLSYTSFAYKKGNASGDEFSVNVTNTGQREGAEVVQCYLSKPGGNVLVPVRELVDFEKIILKPGETKQVSFKIKESDKRYWDEASKGWSVLSGTYTVAIGSSSRDLPVTYTFVEKETNKVVPASSDGTEK